MNMKDKSHLHLDDLEDDDDGQYEYGEDDNEEGEDQSSYEEDKQESLSKKVIQIGNQYSVDEIIKEVDEGTISPPMIFDKWKE